MAAKWEYFVETLTPHNLTTEHLNMRAADGWELVSTAATGPGASGFFWLVWRR